MRTNKWAWAAIGAALLTIQSNATAQSSSRSYMALAAIHTNITAFQGAVDPSKTTEKTWKSDGGTRVVETKTEYDKDGKMVKKTTTTTDYTGRESDKDRTVKKKETREENYGPKGKDGETITTEEPNGKGTKTTVVDDPAGSRPKRTISVEEKDADGKTTKKTTYHRATGNKKATETEYDKDGNPTKSTEWDANGNKERETEYGPNGKLKKEARYDKDGTKTEFEDFDEKGNPRKVTTYHPNGQKKSEGTVDDKGNVTEKKEYDERGREIKKTGANGDVETTEYEGTTGRIRKKTVTHPDGSKDVTDYDDGQPTGTRKYNPHGQQISALDRTSMPENAIAIAPNEIVAGQTFQFTIATLNGAVVPNQPITLDGGSMGKIEATTDLNGVVTAKAPDNWKTMRIVGGALLGSMIIKSNTSSGAPKVTNPPAFVQPGGIVNIPGQGFIGSCAGQQLTIGGQPAKILAASPTSIKAFVPANLPVGPQTLELLQNGNSIDKRTVECVSIAWDQLQNSLVVGQTATRTLRVTGTNKPVNILIQDRKGDSVTVRTTGLLKSSGGANNTLKVNFVATSPGSFAIQAEVADGKTDYEKVLESAERTRKEAAGWEDSAKTQSSDDLKKAFERAAKNLREAAKDWNDAADARMRGNDQKAAELENAAAEHEGAAKSFSERDWAKGKAAEAAAKNHEQNAKDK